MARRETRSDLKALTDKAEVLRNRVEAESIGNQHLTAFMLDLDPLRVVRAYQTWRSTCPDTLVPLRLMTALDYAHVLLLNPPARRRKRGPMNLVQDLDLVRKVDMVYAGSPPSKLKPGKKATKKEIIASIGAAMNLKPFAANQRYDRAKKRHR